MLQLMHILCSQISFKLNTFALEKKYVLIIEN